MSQQVIHLDFVSLSPAAGPEAREHLLEAASQLATLPHVLSLGAIDAGAGPETRSDFDLVFYFLLPEFTALEPFGTDSRYTGFLQGEIAPRLKAFAGVDVSVDVSLDADLLTGGAYATCVALMAPDETYDWEVREALQAWCDTAAPATSTGGLAVGEKQLYRGAALAFAAAPLSVPRPDASRFRTTLIAGTVRALA